MNHHVHTYCNRCKRNLPYGTTVHPCTFLSEERHFVMDPTYLVNVPWWREPLAVQYENNRIYLLVLQKLIDEASEPFVAELD